MEQKAGQSIDIAGDSWLDVVGGSHGSGLGSRRVWMIPLLCGLVGLLLTAGAVAWEIHSLASANRMRFEALSERVQAEIVRRVGVYRYGLMGTRSVFAASVSVERDEFRDLVASRSLAEEFPGALGIGFIRMVGRDEVDAFLARTRADRAPSFEIRSQSTSGPLYVIEYVEPMEVNRLAIGYDIAQEERRHEAAERAMISGEASLSAMVSLVQAGSAGPGFLYLLPFYKQGMPLETPEQRRQAIVGWVYMPIVASRVFKDVADVAQKEIDFEVFDGRSMNTADLIYDDDSHLKPVQGDVTSHDFMARRYWRFVNVEVGGRTWTLALSSTKLFKPEPMTAAWLIGATGILLSGSVVLTLVVLNSSVARARALAQRMTRDLQRLALVAENTNNLVIITDERRRIEWVNPGFTRVTGYTLDEVRGQSPGRLLQSPKTDPAAIRAIRAALNDGKDCRVELLNRSKSGHEYIVDVEIQPLRDEGGKVTGFVAVETDITDQVTQRSRLESIFRVMAEGLLVQSADGAIIDCNPESERILGLSRDQILGIQPRPEAWRCIHENQEAWPESDHPWIVTLKTGESVRNAVMGVQHADGSLKWVSINTQPIRGADGKVLSVVATLADITEQTDARAELDLKERTLRVMFNQSRQFTGQLSTKGTVLEVNQTALAFAGLDDATRGQVIGKPYWDGPWWKHSPHEREWVRGAIALAASGQTVRRETTHIDSTGKVHYIDFSLSPVFDRNGRVMMLIPEGWDVTESKLAADALRQARDTADLATRSKSEFLANMSHEIRTPMTAILGYTDLLAEEWDQALSPRQRLEYITTIKRNGEHLLSIINDILDLSKIETGKMTAEHIDTRPDHLIHEVLSLMSVKARAKGVALTVKYTSSLPAVIKSDPLRLRQILVNLVGNAIKFTEVGSVTIRVFLEKDLPGGPRLNFEVQDTGIGMTREQIDRLFGAFEQADASTTRRFGGTGLGLRISRRLAEILGGEIIVNSEPGRGSRFTFRINTGPLDGVPLVLSGQTAQAVRESSSSSSSKAPQPDLLRSVRILMAEDGPDNQRLIGHHLKKAGAIVSTVDNGEMAIKALTLDRTLEGPIDPAAPYDLVLMDMQMPVMDGYTATRLLRQKGCVLPIVALTAHAMAGDSDKCLDAGCDDYTTKPIDRHKLVTVCAAWLGQRRNFDESSAVMETSAARPVAQASAAVSVPATPAAPRRESLYSDFAGDDSMADLIRDFASKLPQRAAELQRLVTAGQTDDATRLAHQLAGAAGSYGYPTITAVARDIERLCKERNVDPARLAELSQSLSRLCGMAWETMESSGK